MKRSNIFLWLCLLLLAPSATTVAQHKLRLLPAAEQCFTRADSLRKARDYSGAVGAASGAMAIYNNTYGEFSAEFGYAMGRNAEFLFWDGRSWKQQLLEGLYIVGEAAGTRSDAYACLLTLYAQYSSHYNDSLQRTDFASQSVDIRREVLGDRHPDYAWSVAQLAQCRFDGHRYNEAVTLLRQASDILAAHEEDYTQQYADVLYHIYLACRYQDRQQEAVDAMKSLLALKRRRAGNNAPTTIKTMRELVAYYRQIGNDLEAYRLQDEVNQLTSKGAATARPTLQQAQTLSELASSYEYRGDYDKSIPLRRQVLAICEQMAGDNPSLIDSFRIANAATILAETSLRGGRYVDDIMEPANKAIAIWDSIGLNNDTTYAALMNIKTKCYLRLGVYNYVWAYARQAMRVLYSHEGKENSGSDNMTYATALRLAAIALDEAGRTKEAADTLRHALAIIERHRGRQSSSYAFAQASLARMLIYDEQCNQAATIYGEAMGTLQQLVLCDFATRSPAERRATWNKVSNEFTTHFPNNLFLCSRALNDGRFVGHLYNYSALFAKGLMLATETSVAEAVRRTGDARLTARLDSLQQLHSRMERLAQNTTAQQAAGLLELSRQAECAEKELVLMLRQAGHDFTGPLTTTWRDVQQALRPDDIAVEFITFDNDLLGQMTLALTLRKDDDYPQLTLTITPDMMKILQQGDIYQDSSLSQYLWGAMGSRLDGISNICFSPSGPLHSLGVENMAGCSQYRFFRLSSTRELALPHTKQRSAKTAVLYGGLDYDADPAQMQAESRVHATSAATPHADRSLADSLLTRGAVKKVSYLPNTADEVEAIAQLTKRHRIATTVYNGSKGNEESLKALSGKPISMLHVATHGFYAAAGTKTKQPADALADDGPRRTAEDEAMSRSGLLMAGASNAFKGTLPDDVDDGLLTAQEIAQLDLSCTDLVVLSACETALGDVSKSEGVFGLQRGFKKAGAQSIVMSLWKVDDEATSALMTEFYRQLTQGSSPHAALEHAKQAIKANTAKGWDAPRFWAAFILLDAYQ